MSELWTPGVPKVTDDDFTDIGSSQIGTGEEGPQIRLLRCTKCMSLEELPDYIGDPMHDVVLDGLVMQHQQRHPFHDEPDAYLLRVSEELWRNPRTGRKIHAQIWADLKGKGHTGMVPEYYATKSTFHEDAVKCHQQHNRQVPCIDWHADRKRIGNPTKEGWQRGEVKVYLCDFCPVSSAVMTMKRKQRGDYD